MPKNITSAGELIGSKARRLKEYGNKSVIDRSPRDRWITMDNALNRAGHGLTLAEKRIVVLAVSKIDSARPVNPMQPPKTKISAAEYVEFCGVDPNTAYDQLKSAAANLYNRSITFFEPSHKRNSKPLKPARHVMRWVGEAIYHEGEGWVELHWWPALVPSLFGLKKNFTSYQLHQTSALRSVYSWRLLELLMRFESTGWAEYTIEDFATSMDATAKQRENFNNIKKRIIEPAIKELTEKDGWLIEWQPIKKGRRVAALRFDFQRNPQGRLL
jgi:plasmid replication initiation protein